MEAISPPVVNAKFVAAENMSAEEVHSIPAFRGSVPVGRPCNGAGYATVAWKPSPEDLKILNEGGPIYITMLGHVPPHFVSTDFGIATYGQGLESKRD